MHDHEWLKEAILIIFALGGLEIFLWWLDRLELKEQTKLLEDILVTLVEQGKEKEVELTNRT